MRLGVLFALATVSALADDSLARAYAELRNGHYDAAIALFERAVAVEPKAPNIRKDLAYTLLKTGDTEAARDQFRVAMELDPADFHVALEYAFLAYETKERRIARLVFQAHRAQPTAQAAFDNIERDLLAGIERWRRAAEQTPNKFSVHQELARLYEEHNDLDLAARHFLRCWQLRPDMREFLVDLGRVHSLAGRPDEALPPLLAASRGTEPRIAERALDLLPRRYPFVYEFRQALTLDPANVVLRRELGFLHLKMNDEPAAIAEFEKLPQDPLAQEQLALLRPKTASVDARTLADKSYQAGFMGDALKYYRLALERSPHDEQLLLRLGWTLNILRRDEEALGFFRRAQDSADPLVAQEARKAYRNLRPQFAPVRTTVWLFPFYSTRWSSAFSYGQAKAEFRLGKLPIRPYLSLRFVGDLGAAAGGPPLSERAAIPAAGVSVNLKRVFAWAEAGREVRAGVSHGKGWGKMIGNQANSEATGFFATTNQDLVYLSRFENNTLGYFQNRIGYTVQGLVQFHWNVNTTFDSRRLWWGNFAETGPGVRVHVPGTPPGLVLSVDLLRGRHLVETGIPRKPNYLDLRAGFWYAFTR